MIQKDAQSFTNFEQDDETVKDLFKVLDHDRDNRITKDDIMSVAKRYLQI